MLEDEFGFLPAPGFCPASISLRRSDAELRFISRAVEKSRCTLIFASSEGSSTGGGPSLHELIASPGFTVVRDYQGFAPLRALAYLRRTETHPVRMIVLVNHHYARGANRPLPDLGETWFAEPFAQRRLKNPGILGLYMRDRHSSAFGPLRELLGRLTRFRTGLFSFSGSAQAAMLQTQERPGTNDAIARLDGTPFVHALSELCKEDGAEIVLLPLHAKLERSLGLDPDEQTARIVNAARGCRRSVLLREMDGPFWLDRIHWNEEGRRMLAGILIQSNLF
jgi:hypothetical protein